MPAELRRGLIVSCQAEGDSPFNAPAFIAAFAKAAEMGGAVAVRICGVDNVRAVRAQICLPVIGITKGHYADGSVLITPTLDDVRALVSAGADIVALDATARPRAHGPSGTDMVRDAVALGIAPVMADVSIYDEGTAAAAAGAAFVGTTLSGYTPSTAPLATSEPDFDLLSRLARTLPGSLIAEGRIWTPAQARRALELGAHAVVVGTAITRPVDIIRRFVEALAQTQS
jgi:putative N-acetylmannosamine-6-phosphate epimerase